MGRAHKKYKVSAAASSIVPLSFASQVAERWPTNSNRPPGTPAARQQVATAMVHSNGTKRFFFFAYVTSGKVQLVFGKAYTKAVAEMTRMAEPRSGEASEWLYNEAPQQGSSCLVATDFPFWGALVRMLSENHSYPPPTQLRRVGSWWVSLTVR